MAQPAGGAALLAYAISRHDPVIIAGQSMGLFIYVRNLMLIDKARRRLEIQAVGDTPGRSG